MVLIYDVKLKKKVDIKNPKQITKRTKNGRLITMLTGKSPSGIQVYKIVSNQKA